MTASSLMRTDVYNLQDERLGRIEDLVIGGGREVAAIVVGVGGFLGIGERYAALPPNAVRETKRLLRRSRSAAVTETIAAEGAVFAKALQSPEAKEAFSAFFQKRKPDFSKF